MLSLWAVSLWKMTCTATWVKRVGWTVFAVRCVHKRITVGIEATRHKARDGMWVRAVAGWGGPVLGLGPVESLTVLLTETWRCIDLWHCGLEWTHSD